MREPTFTPTVAMLQFAATSKKKPTMQFKSKDGFRIRLVFNRDTNITKVLMDKVYIGSLHSDGTLHLGKIGSIWPDWRINGKNFLFSLLRDPVQAAKTHAALTGECTFCGAELTDERSKEVGYGPVCAENWNLPWGDFQPVDLDTLFN